MKNVLIFIVFYIVSGVKLGAQIIPFNNSLNRVDTICSYNDTINLVTVTGWQAYQTIENTYDGTIDSSICVSLKEDTTYSGISFLYSSMDSTRSLYLKALIDTNNWVELGSNNVYNIYSSLFPELGLLNSSTTCSEEICSGIIMGISTFDTDDNLINKRWIFVSVDSMVEDYGNAFCFPAEYLPNQYITDFIYKYSFTEKIAADTIFMYGATILEWIYGVNFYSLESVPGFYEDSVFVIPSAYLHDFYSPTIVASFNKSGIPSIENTDTIFAAPLPNTETVKTVELRIDPYDVLQIQPYVKFSGGYVVGDTLRHNFHLVNEGGNFCVYYIDLAFTDTSKYIHNSGLLDMNYTTSCLMFGNGGTLEIGEGATLYYGSNGVGILGLAKNAQINLLPNSSLVIGNNVQLFGTQDFDPSIYVQLNAGNKVVFTIGSTIRPFNAQSQEMQLCFYMNGGELDDSALSEEDKKYIRRIYPSANNEPFGKIKIFPNPVTDVLFAQLESETETQVNFQIYDFYGHPVLQNFIQVKSGVYQYTIPISTLHKGMYFIQFDFQGEILRNAFIRL